MRRSRVSDTAVYCARLEVEQALLDDLLAEITVGETYFFREPQQFTVIRDEILPAIVPNRSRARDVRMWSAGCATGEEAYSLAILLRERGLAGSARILATDLSRSALARARKGHYSRWSFRGVSDDIVQRHFRRVGDRFEVQPALRDSVQFGYLNLAEDRYPSLSTGPWGMDLILCRNVLIYFDHETVARVARRLIDCLTDAGWLLLGASDPPIGDFVSCEVVITTAGLAYRRAAGNRLGHPSMLGNPPPATMLEFSHERPVRDLAPSQLPDEQTAAIIAEGNSAADEAQEAQACYAARDYTRAAELSDRSVRRDDSDPTMWVVLVRSLANRGELAAAGQACAAALDRHRTTAELGYLHAVLLAAAGNYGEAAVAARRTLYLDRGLVVAHLALASALARSNDVEGARRAFRNAARLLAAMPPDAVVPASDEEPAGRLAEMVRIQLKLVKDAA